MQSCGQVAPTQKNRGCKQWGKWYTFEERRTLCRWASGVHGKGLMNTLRHAGGYAFAFHRERSGDHTPRRRRCLHQFLHDFPMEARSRAQGNLYKHLYHARRGMATHFRRKTVGKISTQTCRCKVYFPAKVKRMTNCSVMPPPSTSRMTFLSLLCSCGYQNSCREWGPLCRVPEGVASSK